LWATASVSAGLSNKELAESPTCGVKGCLLVLVSMAQVWTAVPDQVQQEPIDGPVSQRWVVVEFADELAV